MKRLPTTVVISFGLASLTLSLLLTASSVGLLPDGRAGVLEERTRFADLFAATCAPAVAASDGKGIDDLVRQVIVPNVGVARVLVVGPDGKPLAEYHRRGDSADGSPTAGDRDTVVSLAIPGDHGDAGHLEMEFVGPGGSAGGAPWLPSMPIARLAMFVTSASFAAYIVYLRVVLRHLDPSSVIPPRVRAMLNVMSEGIVILDREGRIVMANDSFCATAGLRQDAATGHLASQLPWVGADGTGTPAELPWERAIWRGANVRGTPVGLMTVGPAGGDASPHCLLMVNATAILGPGGRVRGAVASFDDVTGVERTNELLRRSNAEVERANVELLRLATTDPLTGCLNRRSFFARADPLLAAAHATGAPPATVMLDIDHFKNINDRFGHAVGDQVLARVAEVVRAACGEGVLPCRYGGEEFCVLLTGETAAGAAAFGERLRAAVAAGPWEVTPVTASVGVCASDEAGQNVSDLLRHADEALYYSKRSGRNRVTVWESQFAPPPSGPLPMSQPATRAA
jgi:diguanylate cyclase (GGDEF)-like protein